MPLISNQLRGTLLVALSGMLYGIVGYCGTMLFREHFSVPAMLFWRFSIATIWVGVSCLSQRKKLLIHAHRYKGLGKAVLFSSVFYSGASAFYFLATEHHIGTGVAMVIFFSFPVFVTLFAWVLSEWKINEATFASLIMVIIGLILLKDHGSNALNIVGVLLGVIAAISYACYVYNSQHTTYIIDTRLLTLLICASNSAIFFLLMIYTHTFTVPTTITAWANVLAIGIIATALPIQLLLDGLKFISSVKASILSVLEPVMVVVVGLAFLGESISSMQVIGIITVLTGAILIQFERPPETQTPSQHNILN
ncbi:MAG: DMT family transporter [Gammaproteobacteria bacterium]